MIREHFFETREKLAVELSAAVAGCLRSALEQEARATMVVSGGTTPVAWFRALREVELDWKSVRITLADERWVDPLHPESNERLVRDELLVGPAARARFVGLWSAGATPEAGCRQIAPVIARLRPFDVVVLGMGGDGHTASLFPGAPNLGEILDPGSKQTCFAVRLPESRPRVSLSLAALLDSQRLLLHIHGEEKLRVLRQASSAGQSEALPVRAVLENATSGVDVFWAP